MTSDISVQATTCRMLYIADCGHTLQSSEVCMLCWSSHYYMHMHSKLISVQARTRWWPLRCPLLVWNCDILCLTINTFLPWQWRDLASMFIVGFYIANWRLVATLYSHWKSVRVHVQPVCTHTHSISITLKFTLHTHQSYISGKQKQKLPLRCPLLVCTCNWPSVLPLIPLPMRAWQWRRDTWHQCSGYNLHVHVGCYNIVSLHCYTGCFMLP